MLFQHLWEKTGFKFYCTHVSNAKGNIAKSNKSELWNRLSFNLNDLERPNREFKKKCHGMIPFPPQMLEIATVFFVPLFWSQPRLVGDSVLYSFSTLFFLDKINGFIKYIAKKTYFHNKIHGRSKQRNCILSTKTPDY